MRFKLLFLSICTLQFVGFEVYVPPIPVPEDLRSELSIVMDAERNMTAIWLENGIVYVSDLIQEGAWTLPAPLSSVLKKSTSPRITIDPSGKTTAIWVEENAIQVATREAKKDWIISKMEPSILEIFQSEERDQSSLSVRLSPFSEKENRALATIQRLDKSLSQSDPAAIPMANAIDAPASSVLTGAQIGFAAGTAAPSNGLAVAGQVGIGTTTLSGSMTLNLNSTSNIFYIGATASKTGPASDPVGINNSCVLDNATALASFGYGFSNQPSITSTGGGTFSELYGAYFSLSGPNNLSTFAYSLYVSRPSFTTGNNYTAYFDSVVGIGNLSLTSDLVVGGLLAANTDVYGVNINVDLGATVGNPISNSSHLYINPTYTTSNAGTIINAYGAYIATGATGGTINNGYNLYVTNPSFGTTKVAGYLENLSVGYTAVAPPTNGLIVTGRVGIGTSSPNSASNVHLSTGTQNKAYSLYVSGSTTDTSAGALIGVYLANTFAPAGTIPNVMGQYVYLNVSPSSGTTTSAYSMWVDGGTTTGGTITNGYGLRVVRPGFGTNKYTAFLDSPVGIGTVASTIQLYVNSTQTATSGAIALLQLSSATGASSGTVSEIDQIYISNDYSQNSGTISDALAVNIAGGTGAGSITRGYGINIASLNYGTTRYGLYARRPSTTGSPTNRYTAYFDPIVGIGATPAADRILAIGGDVRQGANNYGFVLIPTLGVDSATTVNTCPGAYISSSYSSNAGTISAAYGLWVDEGASGGTITDGYGALIKTPVYGTNKYSLNVGGGSTVSSAGQIFGLVVNSNIGCNSGTLANAYNTYLNPLFSNNFGGATISSAFGLYIATGSTAGSITNGYGLYVENPTFGTNKWSAVFGGLVVSSGNKTVDLGSTANRWNTIFYVTATTGTSRLANSRTVCVDCNQTMKRGTGTTYTLGDDADYIPVFCPDCGNHKVEKIQHLPRHRLLERRPAPKIEFLGFKVNQHSGHSRGIQVLYRYVDKEKDNPMSGKENSTFLSDSEYERFLLLSEGEKRIYLRDLGQREWDAMEEVRLMEEECCLLQAQLDAIGSKWIGTDLLR